MERNSFLKIRSVNTMYSHIRELFYYKYSTVYRANEILNNGLIILNLDHLREYLSNELIHYQE